MDDIAMQEWDAWKQAGWVKCRCCDSSLGNFAGRPTPHHFVCCYCKEEAEAFWAMVDGWKNDGMNTDELLEFVKRRADRGDEKKTKRGDK